MRRPEAQGLERRITVHDKKHFELKLDLTEKRAPVE